MQWTCRPPSNRSSESTVPTPKSSWKDILSHCRWNLNTSVLEGINNKIKVLKRIAYGYRDEEYFFLKIRAAFPGNP